MSFREALPHGPLEEVFDNIFVVGGTIPFGPGIRIGRNMTVLRRGTELTIINSVRMNSDGERALEKLGTVKHLVRLGFFHGVDDPYFMDRFSPTFWSGARMVPVNVKPELRKDLPDGAVLPFGATSFAFTGGDFDENALVLDDILVTCDSVQNWVDARGCSFLGGIMMRAMGFIEPAKIGPRWVERVTHKQPNRLREDFERLEKLPFKHLLSAHGVPLREIANEKLREQVLRVFADKATGRG